LLTAAENNDIPGGIWMRITNLYPEDQEQGGVTIYLGTEDENYRTSISGKDLYPDVLGNLSAIKNVNNHPYEFYQKVGFSLVGVIPDANGFGKPDIIMAKRV
jgi:aminoglycoside 6'-N-acetyltransferase I